MPLRLAYFAGRPEPKGVILGVSSDNKIFIFNADELLWIVENPKTAFRKYVIQPQKLYGMRDFAIDSPQDFIPHAINHEIGHMVFNKSQLENKEALLREIWKKADKSSISQYAKKRNENFLQKHLLFMKRRVYWLLK